MAENKDSITKIKWEHSEGMYAASILAIYYWFWCNGYACICSKQIQKFECALTIFSSPTAATIPIPSWTQLPQQRYPLLDQSSKQPSPPPYHACTSHRVTWSSVAGTLTISGGKQVHLCPTGSMSYYKLLAIQHTFLQRCCLSPGIVIFAAHKGEDSNFKNVFTDTLKIAKLITDKKQRNALVCYLS